MSSREPGRLVASCERLGIDLETALADRLCAYLDLLYFWNASAGLTSVARDDAWRLHVLDSLLFLDELSGASRIVDVGSGGGFPGIPLAVVMAAASFELVESKRRKCSFLREAIRELDLGNCEVLETDAGSLPGSGRTYDAVVSRAFMPPVAWIEFAYGLLQPGGRLLVAAGRDGDPEEIKTAAERANLRLVSERKVILPRGSEVRRIYRFDA